MSTSKLAGLRLASADPDTKAAFYAGCLGMKQLAPARFGYGVDGAWLEFTPASGPYRPARSDLYWKFAIAVPDLDLACRQLQGLGVKVSPPQQFQNVGYLSHLSDPEGFQIELIQHWQHDNRPDTPVDQTLLGGGPTLNLITLRTTDPDAMHALCETQLGMQLLSVQPVADYGFTLYFFGFTDDSRPDADPTGLANREWTYQRPFTVLEVQHVHELPAVTTQQPGQPGYGATLVSGAQIPPDAALLGLCDLD